MEDNESSLKPTTILNQQSVDIPNATVAIDPISLQNEMESIQKKEAHHAVFYKSDGKSLPDFPSLQVVPRSPSTNVHVDINDINYRDDDTIPNHDKYMMNETSSTISSHSNFSNFSFPSKQNSNSTPNRNEKPNKLTNIESPFRTKRKDPKIPEVFAKIHSPKSNPRKFNISHNKLSYSWPKYEIEQSGKKNRKKRESSHHLYETAVTKFRNY